MKQDGKVQETRRLRAALEKFLRAIIEQEGCNDHVWLVCGAADHLAALLSEPQAAQEADLCVFCGCPKFAHDAVTVGTLEQRVRCPVEIPAPPVLPAPPEGEKP